MLDWERNNLNFSILQANDIRTQGLFISEQIVKKINISLAEDIERLKKANISLIKLEKEKIVLEVV